MLLLRKCLNCFATSRAMTTAPKSHYESLGVKKNATHGEIKTAYYKLSKLYHPDTNKGSEESLVKFREVTDAYEVLGNVKTRKMYDRGLAVGSSGTVLRQDVEDDPTTKFYKQREKRSQVPTNPAQGPTVYDFDAWSRAHYDTIRDRKATSKAKYDRIVSRKMDKRIQRESEVAIVIISLAVIAYITMFFSDISTDHNFVKVTEKEVVKR